MFPEAGWTAGGCRSRPASRGSATDPSGQSVSRHDAVLHPSGKVVTERRLDGALEMSCDVFVDLCRLRGARSRLAYGSAAVVPARRAPHGRAVRSSLRTEWIGVARAPRRCSSVRRHRGVGGDGHHRHRVTRTTKGRSARRCGARWSAEDPARVLDDAPACEYARALTGRSFVNSSIAIAWRSGSASSARPACAPDLEPLKVRRASRARRPSLRDDAGKVRRSALRAERISRGTPSPRP